MKLVRMNFDGERIDLVANETFVQEGTNFDAQPDQDIVAFIKAKDIEGVEGFIIATRVRPKFHPHTGEPLEYEGINQ